MSIIEDHPVLFVFIVILLVLIIALISFLVYTTTQGGMDYINNTIIN